jgi:hypothetical protein
MAAINDNANVVTGLTLDLFNQMEVVVARDGDQPYAQLILQDAFKKIISTTQLPHAVRTGAAVSSRKP